MSILSKKFHTKFRYQHSYDLRLNSDSLIYVWKCQNNILLLSGIQYYERPAPAAGWARAARVIINCTCHVPNTWSVKFKNWKWRLAELEVGCATLSCCDAWFYHLLSLEWVKLEKVFLYSIFRTDLMYSKLFLSRKRSPQDHHFKNGL